MLYNHITLLFGIKTCSKQTVCFLAHLFKIQEMRINFDNTQFCYIFHLGKIGIEWLITDYDRWHWCMNILVLQFCGKNIKYSVIWLYCILQIFSSHLLFVIDIHLQYTRYLFLSNACKNLQKVGKIFDCMVSFYQGLVNYVKDVAFGNFTSMIG